VQGKGLHRVSGRMVSLSYGRRGGVSELAASQQSGSRAGGGGFARAAGGSQEAESFHSKGLFIVMVNTC
jgi:hypothetical protein